MTADTRFKFEFDSNFATSKMQFVSIDKTGYEIKFTLKCNYFASAETTAASPVMTIKMSAKCDSSSYVGFGAG